jgi:3-carboxy-cis,cis-muconate cycloisomerase
MPWHTRRSPVTAVGDALAVVCDSLGVIASDVVSLSRPEVAELAEGGFGGASSTMPHKRNPVLSVLVRAAALQTPLLAAQLHSASATAVDERPDGAWHSEWPALRRLFELTATAAAQTVDLVTNLSVATHVMSRHAQENADRLLVAGGTRADPLSNLGAADAFIDHALRRLANWEEGRG